MKAMWKNLWSGLVLSSFLFVFGISVCAQEPDNTRTSMGVSSFEELKQVVEGAGGSIVVTLGNDIVMEEPIIIQDGQDITIVDDGTARTISGVPDAKRMFEIKEGGKLTLKTSIPGQDELLIMDGENFTHYHSKDTGQMITCNGQLVMEGGTLQNNYCNDSWTGTIVIAGKNADFNMKGGVVKENVYAQQFGGIVRVSAGAAFVMEGGYIMDNDTCPEGQINNAAVFVEAKGNSRFQMSGGEIRGNHGYYGGVFLGESAYPDFTSLAVMKMDGGKITENTAQAYGGGVAVIGPASFTMEDGEITNNKARTGGGIATYDLYYSAGGSGVYDIDRWKQFFPAEFIMNGGKIDGNMAIGNGVNDGGCGGGIYVGSDSVVLHAGYITNNTANRQGGGVYVGAVPYRLYMYDTLITENTATILGGGLWFCPTGDAQNTVTNGGAVFGNEAKAESGLKTEAAGDDFVAVPQENKNHFVTLADRMLGGGEVSWYKDGGSYTTTLEWNNVLGLPDDSARYDAHDPGERITEIKNNKEGIALKSVVSEEAAQLARKEAQLFVTGNMAPRGGGVGSNGAVIIGIPQDEWNLDIYKEWADGIPEEQKKEVTVRLKIGEYTLDTVTLNQENGWKASFTQLPNPDSLSEGMIITAIEEGDEYLVEYTDVSRDEKNKRMALTIKNRVKPSGNLIVSKTVAGADKDRAFPFTVTLSDTTIAGAYGDMEFIEGIARFTLKHSESKTASGLPAGISYTVEEEESKEYLVTKTGDAGVIPDGDTAYASFENQEIPKEESSDEGGKKKKNDREKVSPQTQDDSSTYGLLAAMVLSVGIGSAILYARKKA